MFYIIERLQELLDNRLDQKIYYEDDFKTFEAAIARIKQLEDGWKRCFFAYGNEVMKETSEKTEERWQKALEDK